MPDVSGLQVFLCADLWKDAGMLHAAYCDSQGVTEAFIKNGMSHALAALGCHEGRSPDAWKYDVVVNPKTRQVSLLHAQLGPPQLSVVGCQHSSCSEVGQGLIRGWAGKEGSSPHAVRLVPPCQCAIMSGASIAARLNTLQASTSFVALPDAACKLPVAAGIAAAQIMGRPGH